MRAVQSQAYGSYENLSVDIIPKPSLVPKGKILVQIYAVALAPGDVRVLSGKCKELNGVPSFPYIPGGDCCGIVEDMGDSDPALLGFDVGDRIAARFDKYPRDALAEYALISPTMANIVPDNVSSEDAAALASSATIAMHLSKRIHKDERVLIIGAGGGVGSHLCQFLKMKGVKFIAGVSRDPDRLTEKPILCHKALDYTTTDILNLDNWETSDPFDTIIDLGGSIWPILLTNEGREKRIVKSAKEGGRFLTTTPDDAWFELHGIFDALAVLLFPSLWRALYSRAWKRSSLPSYTYAMSLDNDIDILNQTLFLASADNLEACIDPRGPFNFTTEGVQEAFKVQESRHAQGKVVISFKSSSPR